MARRHSSVRQSVVVLIVTPQGTPVMVVVGRGIGLFGGLGLGQLSAGSTKEPANGCCAT